MSCKRLFFLKKVVKFMVIIGVVAEFNPFHNGHKYQINEIIKQNKNSINIAVISADLTQRAEYAILNKYERAKLAILNGYDIVVELPIYYSMQNAEIFSTKSSQILNELGVNIQYAGSENSILEIENLYNYLNRIDIDLKIRDSLKKGNNYPTTMLKILSENDMKDMYKSNNILSLEYLRAIKKYNLKQKFDIIQRKDVEFNSDKIINNIASATFIRNNIYDLKNIKKTLPDESYEILKNKDNILSFNEEIFYNLLKYKVLIEDIENIYDMNYEIKKYIYDNLKNTNNYNEYINKKIPKNMSKRRIRRVEWNILLGIKNEYIKKENNIEYINVLAINEKGAKYLKKLNSNKLFSNFKDIEKNFKNNNLFKIEKKAKIINEILLNRREKLNNYFIKENK